MIGFRWLWCSRNGSNGNRRNGERLQRRGLGWSKGLGQIRTELFRHRLIKITCAAVNPDNFSLVGILGRRTGRGRDWSRMARMGRRIMYRA